jgi:hypothetical protein
MGPPYPVEVVGNHTYLCAPEFFARRGPIIIAINRLGGAMRSKGRLTKCACQRSQSKPNGGNDRQVYVRQFPYKEGRGCAPRSAPAMWISSMTTGEAAVSSRITLIGIALIWMTAQVLVVVAHDFWASRTAHRNTIGEWCCGDENCEMRVPISRKAASNQPFDREDSLWLAQQRQAGFGLPTTPSPSRSGDDGAQTTWGRSRWMSESREPGSG